MTKQTARRQTAVLLGLLLLLLALNLPRLMGQSFWADECYVINLSQLSLPDFFTRLATGDAHPPLHDLILMLATRVFGASPLVYQSVSLAAMLGLGVLAMTWVRKRFGFLCAALYLLLITFTRSMIDYATEVRMYGWAALLVTLCMAFGYELLRSNKLWLWAGFVLTAVAASYTHYYALVAAGMVFFGLLVYRVAQTVLTKRAERLRAAQESRPPVRDKKQWLWLLAVAGVLAACIIAYAPWLGTLISQLRDGLENWWMQEVPPLQSFLLFPFGWQATGYVLLPCAVAAFAAYFLAAARVSCAFSLTDPAARKFAWDKKALDHDTYFVAWGIGVFAGVLAVGLVVSYVIKPTFLEKYQFPAVGVLLLALAVALSKFKPGRKAVAAIAAVLVLTGLLNFATVWRDEATFEKNTVQTRAMLQEEIQLGDKIVSDSDHLAWGVLPYNFPENAAQNFDWNFPPSETEQAVWVCDMRGMMQQELPAVLAREGLQAQDMGEHTLHWYTFRLYKITRQ